MEELPTSAEEPTISPGTEDADLTADREGDREEEEEEEEENEAGEDSGTGPAALDTEPATESATLETEPATLETEPATLDTEPATSEPATLEVEPITSDTTQNGIAHGEIEVVVAGGKEEEVDTFSPSEKISLLSVHNYRSGESVHVYLPGVPVVATVASNLTSNRSRGPQFVISLEHGPFNWKVYKYYSDFLALRRTLAPMRDRIAGRIGGRIGRGRKRGYLPHLLTINDINPLQITRTQSQLPKCSKFLNAIFNDREFRSHRSTLKFFEISRLSFVEDLGAKHKEGVITKRSGGHRRVTTCLGCGSCCVCRCSVWRQRWLVLKDSYLTYIRSDRRTIAGVLLFDDETTIKTGSLQTGILLGLEITTKTRNLLVKCPSRVALKEWKNAINAIFASSGRVWVMEKRFLSFAPPRENCPVTWFVDGEKFMSQVANALLAAKEEIYITDWMLSPQIYLKRSNDKSSIHNLSFRLDKILLKKAREGVRVYIQIYKEVTVAIVLGSEYAKEELKHPNIVVFRHPEHIQTGVYKWAHHEKIVVIDQTLAFVGGIDLAFGRYDDNCHDLCDTSYTVAIKSIDDRIIEEARSFKWHGKDYHNPFFRDITRPHEPFDDDLDRSAEPRMPWHDISSCVLGAPARDVARHFIQRYNFTRHEQRLTDNFLLPRGEFCGTDQEREESMYLQEVMDQRKTSNADVQILRSVDQWSAGTTLEQSILNAYLATIEKAEHFIYIENQFFISSLKDVRNSIVDALRARIGKAHEEKQTFRVIIVMPLLPSFNGDLADSAGTVPRAIIHWNYKTFVRGEESLYNKLTHINGVPSEEIPNYISVYGLRTYGQIENRLVTEIVYVHSKCMIVDDRYTIIGSANINDRSMLGERDSEMAIFVEDREMIEGKMNGEVYSVGKFAHSLRCQLFREHLGLLPEQIQRAQHIGCVDAAVEDIDVQDPACERFYNAWCGAATKNMDIYEKVFGGRCIPTDSVKNYAQYRSFKDTSGLVESDSAVARKLLGRVQGYVVPMPLHFLSEEDLEPKFGEKESFVPEIFT